MKRNIIGKQINEFAASRNDLPDYFGDKFSMPSDEWERPLRKINGEFMAQKYNAILEIVADNKCDISIQEDFIYILCNNATFKIGRDLLTDTFLIPKLKKTA